MPSDTYATQSMTGLDVPALNLENTLNGTNISLADAHGFLDAIETMLDGPKPIPAQNGPCDPPHKPSLIQMAHSANDSAQWLRERLVGLRNKLGN